MQAFDGYGFERLLLMLGDHFLLNSVCPEIHIMAVAEYSQPESVIECAELKDVVFPTISC